MAQNTPASSASKTGAHTILSVVITVDPANIDEFLKGMHICYDPIIEEKECLSFELFQNVDEPGVFRILELWDGDKNWFMSVQAKKPYYVPYHEVTTKLWTKPRTLEFFERVPGMTFSKAT